MVVHSVGARYLLILLCFVYLCVHLVYVTLLQMQFNVLIDLNYSPVNGFFF